MTLELLPDPLIDPTTEVELVKWIKYVDVDSVDNLEKLIYIPTLWEVELYVLTIYKLG